MKETSLNDIFAQWGKWLKSILLWFQAHFRVTEYFIEDTGSLYLSVLIWKWYMFFWSDSVAQGFLVQLCVPKRQVNDTWSCAVVEKHTKVGMVDTLLPWRVIYQKGNGIFGG